MNNQNISWSGTAADMAAPVTPCDDAYATLRGQQEMLDIAIGNLSDRLSRALRGEVARIDGNSTRESEPCPLSEIHGQLLAAGNRTRDAVARVNALIDRLTI